jgi:hypothetical protein
MIIKEHINVKDDRLIDGLTPVVRIMSQIECSREQDVAIDFSDTRFVSPVFALSLIVYLSQCGKQISFKNVPDYLERIGLIYGGIKPDQMRQTEFMAVLEKYASKTYIPIIDFAAGRNSDAKEVVSSIAENMIIQQLTIRSNVANGLKYMIDETLDNITNLPDAENRGFGIKTSKQMLIQGLGGQYLMISGSSLYIKSRNLDSFYAMPHGLRWNGTIVALRIPYYSVTFNYIDYIE